MTVHIIGATKDGEETLIATCGSYEDAKERQDAIMGEGLYISTWIETEYPWGHPSSMKQRREGRDAERTAQERRKS